MPILNDMIIKTSMTDTSSASISFVMPAYNCEKTIEESVESIMNGNFLPGDELIIVNDGSSDHTAHVIERLKNIVPIIISLINDKNKGCPASRNIGIQKATNPYIFNLDSDNILTPGSVRTLLQYLLQEHADVAAFGEYYYFIKSIQNVTHKWICQDGVMTLADFLAGPINPGPGGNFLFTKAIWEKIDGYWEYGAGLHEAWGFALKMLVHEAQFVVLRNSFYYHRHGHASLFVRESKKNTAESSSMATKMISPFLSLLLPEDVAWIKSPEGSTCWYEQLSVRPIRLANG